MNDYALTRLGPQRFEELTQALALRLLGPSVQVFGDGPDGGREASFENLSNFPTPDAPWAGYGVLQAKFRKRPDDVASNAKWLVGHMMAELEEWANPESNRVRNGRVPDYLLVATNVVLSSVPGTGGIDRVQTALWQRAHALGLPLKGVEVWHYDKICRLLDDSKEIRHANADAVLPGDVLARLDEFVKQLGGASLASSSAASGLPREVRSLLGREAEVAEGLRVLEGSQQGSQRAVLVTGAPGIGKSAVALRLSTLAAKTYPDGQFHLNPSLSVEDGQPADLVPTLLRVLLPRTSSLPDERPQQLALLRTSLAHRRVLLFIDDVTSEEALLDLLRMDGPFALVCTSRAKLSGLTGVVHPLELQPLSAEHGEELVRTVAGLERLTDAQVSSLAEACAGHPLALQIAAAHLASRPRASVSRFLEAVASPDRGVRTLKAGQDALLPVLERSLTALSPEQADLFTTLGVLPHMSLTTDVVAAATVSSLDKFDEDHVDDVADLLDSLFELCLIEQIDADRYVLHDILHRFARHKSVALSGTRREAVIRQTCVMLAVRTRAATESIGFTDEEATVPAQSNAGALRTLDADRPGAVALTALARQHEVWAPLVHLASELTGFLALGSHWRDLERVYLCVLEAGTRCAEPEWTSSAQHNLAAVAAHLGDSQRAAELLHSSAQAAHEAGNLYQMLQAELGLSTLLINLGRSREAIPLLRRGLPYWRITNQRTPLAHTLSNLGLAHTAIGQFRRAEEYLLNSKNISALGSPADVASRGAITALLRRTGRMKEAAHEACQDIERARSVGSREWEAKALLELAETPVEQRPESAPPQPLEAALALYRDTGDAQGQVRVLFRLGDQAASQADIDQAAALLSECANLAYEIGDYEHAARSLAYLAAYHGGIGHLNEAETHFAQALDLARSIDHPGALADALQKKAKYLWQLGQINETVDLLAEAAGCLEPTDDKHSLDQISATLGEALVVTGRWQEGAAILHSIASATSTTQPTTKARALRALATVYSRRDLHTEAMSAITAALELYERAGHAAGILDCRLALGNVLARHGNWSDAVDQYDTAAEVAAERRDHHLLIVARTHAEMCRLSNGQPEAAVALTHLIPLAQQLGMKSIEVVLHVRLGAHYAEAGDLDQAVTEFHASLSISEQLGDRPSLATCHLNLARAYHALGSTDLSRTHAREAFCLHHDLNNWSDAAQALLHLLALHYETSPDDDAPAFSDLTGYGKRLDDRVTAVIQALEDRLQQPPVPGPSRAASSPRTETTARQINISDTVRQELAGADIAEILVRLENSRQTCAACDLLIDETGEAELLALHHARPGQIVLTLAHPHCMPSSVLLSEGPAPTQHSETYEVECILFEGDSAGIIVDCYGGYGPTSQDSGSIDLILRRYGEAGFPNLLTLISAEGGHTPVLRHIPAVENRCVTARLEDHRVSIVGPHGLLLPPFPLNFYPHWYQRAREGSLTVVIGRNLQGMAADDPSYLSRAIALGHTVGATVPLTVVRPSRNSPCPCMMRTGRKFKKCCGRNHQQA
ncbi:tetratricopeptide repeat protein, partial [Streptomyces sp. NPDC127105]|uniref:tetratricopeptide repeat protein n=1 Tax=Streptomyces sp. NPDC127105 TaxID=3345359 RepID=UPI0036516090